MDLKKNECISNKDVDFNVFKVFRISFKSLALKFSDFT